MKIPANASAEVKAAFQELWNAMDGLTRRDIDLNGRRVVNAGGPIQGSDYIRRQDVAADYSFDNFYEQLKTKGLDGFPGKLAELQPAKILRVTSTTNPKATDPGLLFLETDTGLMKYTTGSGYVTINQAMWPIGSVFLSVVNTNPASLLGFGTWSQIAQGQMLAGFKTGDADFGTLEGTGGSKTANLAHTHSYSDVVNHTHPVSISDPQHHHTQQTRNTGSLGTSGSASSTNTNDNSQGQTLDASTGITATTSNPAGGVASGTTGSGGSAAQSVLNPYFTVYVWKRTA